MNNNDLHISKDCIESNIDEWTPLNLGEKFTYREHQKEEIITLIYNVVNHKVHNQICEAPTGSGKSIINIVVACILNTYYNLSSYILVSDLFLWDQYDQFIKKNKTLKNVAILKGQTGNYKCDKNNEDMRTADCKLAGFYNQGDTLKYATIEFAGYFNYYYLRNGKLYRNEHNMIRQALGEEIEYQD